MVSTVKMSKDAETNSLDTCPPVYNLIGRVGMKINNCTQTGPGKCTFVKPHTIQRQEGLILAHWGKWDVWEIDMSRVLHIEMSLVQVNTVEKGIPGKENVQYCMGGKKCVNKAIILSIE